MTLLIILIIVSSALVLFIAIFRRYSNEKPERFLLEALDPEGIVQEIVTQLDNTPWQLESHREGVSVYSSDKLPCPFTGFRTVIEPEATLEQVVRFLGDDLLEAFAELNKRYVSGDVIRNIQTPPMRIMRTCFSMYPGMAGREFLHILYQKQLSRDCWVIAYHSIDDPDLPSVTPGFVRCPIFPSGQRLTRLAGGRVRVEHLMVYDLAGAVSKRTQNLLFRPGHIKAYHQEWQKLIHKWNGPPSSRKAET